MNLRPVIERELRVAARLRSTYSNRSAPAGLLTLVTGFLLFVPAGWSSAQQGQAMFATLNTILFCLIWLIVPLSTADCLSREKREDTLGLLLLTPLRPFELVVSKLFSALWQSSVLLVAAVPMLLIPLLVGGVNLLDVTRATLSLITALLSAVAVGVGASSLCERRGRAWLVVLVLGAGWLGLQLSGHGLLFMLELALSNPSFSPPWAPNDFHGLIVLPALGWFMQSGVGPLVSGGEFNTTAGRVLVSAVVLVITFAACCQIIWLAAGRVRRFAEARFLTARQEQVRSWFTRERLALGVLDRRRRRLLDGNPIEWMQSRRWSHRLVKWGWLLVVSAVLAVTTTFDGSRLDKSFAATLWLGTFMLFSLLLVSASSLQHERENGALELVLVTQVSPRMLMRGRLNSLWKSYLPAAALVTVGCWAFAMNDRFDYSPYLADWRDFVALVALTLFFAIQLITLPVIGLCFSLGCRNAAEAVVNTLAASLLVPWFGVMGLVLVGIGAHAEINLPPERRLIPLWASITIWCVGYVAIGLAGWLAGRKASRTSFLLTTPVWFARWRVGPVAAISLPLVTFAFLQLGGGDWLSYHELDDEPLFFTWLGVGLALLIFTGHCAKRTLLQLLERREFGPKPAAN